MIKSTLVLILAAALAAPVAHAQTRDGANQKMEPGDATASDREEGRADREHRGRDQSDYSRDRENMNDPERRLDEQRDTPQERPGGAGQGNTGVDNDQPGSDGTNY